MVLAVAALEFQKNLFERTKLYTNKKKIWSPTKGEPVLTSIP